jgi:hypothetical protein
VSATSGATSGTGLGMEEEVAVRAWRLGVAVAAGVARGAGLEITLIAIIEHSVTFVCHC